MAHDSSGRPTRTLPRNGDASAIHSGGCLRTDDQQAIACADALIEASQLSETVTDAATSFFLGLVEITPIR
jgi:hypothetical protein